MLGFRSLVVVAVATCLSFVPTFVSAHQLPEPHVDEPPQVFSEGPAFGFASHSLPSSRHLRAEHDGGDVNPDSVQNPGGLLGPLYASNPELLAPLAMASDNIHNSNAAVSGVQHTPDGIFEA